jgi:hypothetical protein
MRGGCAGSSRPRRGFAGRGCRPRRSCVAPLFRRAALLDRMRLSRKGPPAVSLLLADRRAIAGVAPLGLEGFAAKNAGLGLRVDPTLRPLKHPIDRSTAFVAAHDMLRRLSPPVADNRTTAPLAWFGPPPCAKVNPSQVGVGLGRAALGADLGDVAADARPRTVANRNPIDRVAGGHLPMAEFALHPLRIKACPLRVHIFIRNAGRPKTPQVSRTLFIRNAEEPTRDGVGLTRQGFKRRKSAL